MLTYKPQYGLLFPLVLVASGQWRVVVSAAITALLLVLVSIVAFGLESWLAFFQWMPLISKAVLSEGAQSWLRLQSVYAMVRCLGGGDGLAWSLQAMVAATVAVGLIVMWRSEIPYSIKAAALATGTMLCSPYTYMYDFAVLALPVGFLLRTGYETGFRSHEPLALASVLGLLASFPILQIPVGLAATLVVAALVVLRAAGRPEATDELAATSCR
jgi:hypothetical protein